ncbi:MAG: FtsX-like permease family protein [Candidatus Thorarchaeota archaeon]
MNERQDYASTDLKRRPFRTTVMILSMTTVVAFTVFLFLFANTLLDVTRYVTGSGLRESLTVFYETFIWATLLLVLILGVVVFSSMISLEMVSRRKDIGLMKAIGTLMDTVFDHFMAQAVILLLVSVALGVSIGTLMYFGGILWLSSVVQGLRFDLSFPLIQIGFLVFVYLLAGYFAAQKPIYDAVHELPITTLNPQVGTRVRLAGYLDSFGLSFRIATKVTGRRIRGSRRTLLSLFLSIALASMLWVGGGIVHTTTGNYINQSMGTNVVAVGNPAVLSQYYQAYSLNGEPLDGNTTLVNSSYVIPTALIDEIAGLGYVTAVDQRLVECTRVQEGPGIVWNPTLQQWEHIGDDREGVALLIGIDWDHTISTWYYEGDRINATNQAWIGGQMANTLYEDPLVQTLRVKGASFEIRAVAFDIANGGMVAILPLSAMMSLWGVNGTNLLLVQVKQYTASAVSQIEEIAHQYGLDIYRQQSVLDENIAVVGSIWYLLQPLPVMALLSAFLALTNYLMVAVFGRFRDYVIMRSIGAKPSFIAKTIAAEGILTGFKAGAPAILASILFSVYLLVPEAAVPSVLYIPLSAMLMMGALVVVSVLAAIPVYLLFMSRMEMRVSEFSV